MAENTPKQSSADRLYYEMALWRLSEQNRAIESIDRKLASSIAVWGVLVVIFVGLVALGEGSAEGGGSIVFSVGRFEWVIGATVGVLFLSSAFCAVNGYLAKGWNYGPKLSDLGEHTKQYNEETLLQWTADALAEAQRLNDEGIARKAMWSNWSMGLSLAALVVIVVSLLASSFPC